MGRKWKCIYKPKMDDWFTVGEVYEEDSAGSVTDNQGHKWTKGIEIPSRYAGYKFEEVNVTMSVKEKIRNGAMVKLDNERYYIALIGGVYSGAGVLSQLGGCDYFHLSSLDEDQIEAIYEVQCTCDGIDEMLEVAKGEIDWDVDFKEIYRKPCVREMTVAEIEKELGYAIKVIKEDK